MDDAPPPLSPLSAKTHAALAIAGPAAPPSEPAPPAPQPPRAPPPLPAPPAAPALPAAPPTTRDRAATDLATARLRDRLGSALRAAGDVGRALGQRISAMSADGAAAGTPATADDDEELRQLAVGAPHDFRHVGHVGWDGGEGFNVRDVPPEWRSFLRAAGVKKSDLQDPDTRRAIFEVIQQQLKLPAGTATGGAPPVPPAPTAPALPAFSAPRLVSQASVPVQDVVVRKAPAQPAQLPPPSAAAQEVPETAVAAERAAEAAADAAEGGECAAAEEATGGALGRGPLGSTRASRARHAQSLARRMAAEKREAECTQNAAGCKARVEALAAATVEGRRRVEELREALAQAEKELADAERQRPQAGEAEARACASAEAARMASVEAAAEESAARAGLDRAVLREHEMLIKVEARSVGDLCAWEVGELLREAGFTDEVAREFEVAKVEGSALAAMTDEAACELGLTQLDQRLRLRHAVMMVQQLGRLPLRQEDYEVIARKGEDASSREAIMVATWVPGCVAAWLQSCGAAGEQCVAISGELLLQAEERDLGALGVPEDSRDKVSQKITWLRQRFVAALSGAQQQAPHM